MPKISENRRNNKKQHILEISKSLFSESGYSRVSVNEIIKTASISKGGFYVYFKSKQEIFLEIVKQSDYIKSAIGEHLPKDISATQKIRKYLETRLNSLHNEETCKWVKYAIEFWSTVTNDYQLDEIREQRVEKFRIDIESIILDGINTGEFKNTNNVNEMCYFILSTIDGLAFMTSVMNQRITPEIVELTIQIILNYIKHS